MKSRRTAYNHAHPGMVGALLGHYRILRLVGKGGMGEVYAARDETLGREVAIKVLPADLNARPEDLERFAREAKTIASLNHRAIVTLHSFEEAGGVHFITMELVEGEPLASKIPAQGLRFSDLLTIAIEITEAVSAAHDRGIVHRDLKPANVMVTPEGRIKVLDFGLAKLQPLAGQSELTTASTARDLYVAPAGGGEPWQVTDDPHLDWAPVWSPDGGFLYLASTRGGSMNLWRLPMDQATGKSSGSPEPATTPSAYVARPRMAGDRLVFEARVLTSNIYRAAFDAARGVLGDAEPVTSGSRAFRWVEPSPDGQLLVIGTGYLQQEDLFLSKADGSDLRQLTTDAFNDRYPHWSPHSDVIAFYSDRSGKYEVWTTTPAGQLKQLTDAREYSALYPRWSPDGSRMTFTDVLTQGATFIFDPTKPWKDQQPDRLPPPDGPGTYLEGVGSWSPDGNRLAGRIARTNAIVVYDIASRTYQKVGDVHGLVRAWLKDGRLLVAVSPTDVRLVDPATGAARPVMMPKLGVQTLQELRLSRDERLAYFNLSTQGIDVGMVTLRTDDANGRK